MEAERRQQTGRYIKSPFERRIKCKLNLQSVASGEKTKIERH